MENCSVDQKRSSLLAGCASNNGSGRARQASRRTSSFKTLCNYNTSAQRAPTVWQSLDCMRKALPSEQKVLGIQHKHTTFL
eukprot:6475230-Amphidinium_carterae.1